MVNKSKSVECELITGEKREVLADKMAFRPAAYAIIYQPPKLLLVNTKSTNKWFFPGGAVEKGEKMETAIRREVQEETGIILDRLKFFTFKESFFYYEPHDQGYHCFNFFYLATPRDAVRSPIKNDPTDEADRHEWVDIHSLRAQDMQSFAGEILEVFLRSIK